MNQQYSQQLSAKLWLKWPRNTKHPIPDIWKYLILGILMIMLSANLIFASAFAQTQDTKGLSTLNVRLSSKIIRPPKELITTTINIPNIEIAKPMVGPPSKSAILEDDQRHRMIVLTSENNGDLTAYMLDNIDLTPHLSDLRSLAANRGCGRDRMTITGGLGCVALCLKDIIEAKILP